VQTPAAPIAAREKKNLKRKAKDYTSNTDPTEAGTSIKRGKTSAKPAKPATEKHTASKNTAVYVTGLPPDTMVEEMAARFGKCGVIMEDDDEQPRIKLYADAEGNFNGEALVVFFKEESVTLAINLLDEAELRLGESTTVMSVRKGEFGHKAEGGNVVRRVVDKKKATKRIIKLQR
jgi:HIV Tat-specific factor 1